MHTALFLAAVASVAYAAPRPQLINLDDIALDFAPPDLVKAPINVESDIPASSTTDAITPLQSVSAKKRGLVEKRDGDCSPYPAGSGPVPSPDTPSAFQSDGDFAAMATSAPTPDGYVSVFTNLGASLQASNYMGLYTLTSYDTLTCASKCDQASGCSAFNVYLERDPTVNANAQNCPNPPSTTNYKCTLWGAPIAAAEATNTGQYQDSFQVVIAGSNGYNKDSPPASVSCYSGPQELGGAINAPPSSGSYMGYQYFPFSQSQGYNPQVCADACDTQTLYDSQHPAPDGSFMSCAFFNAYVLSKNAIPQGLYCSMYNQTWDPSYGTNYGQYRGSDRYTVSESYSYSKTCPNPNQSAVSSSSQMVSSTTTAASTSSAFSSATSSSPSSSAVTIFSSMVSSASSSFSSATPSNPSSAAVTTSSSVGSSTASPPTSSTASTYTPNETCDPYPNNLVLNPRFICGLAPWVSYSPSRSSYSIGSSGYEYTGAGPYIAGTNPPSVSQQIAVTAGQTYQLTFKSLFPSCTGETKISVGGYTVGDCDYPSGTSHLNTVTLKAAASSMTLVFDFYNSGYIYSYNSAYITDVILVPAPPQPSTSSATSASATASGTATCNSALPIIQNGNFETNTLSPWVEKGLVGQSSGGVVSGGSTKPGGGSYAYLANLQTPNSPYAGTVSQSLSQTLNTCPGTNYSVSVDYQFVYTQQGKCTLNLPLGLGTVDSYGPGGWQRVSGSFQAAGTTTDTTFTFACASPGEWEVDNVNVTAIH